MDAVLRAASIYFFLLLVFRLAGKRTLVEATPFDLVLLLIVSEATQQAMIGDDFSLTNAFIVIATLGALDILLSEIKQRFPRAERVLDGVPLVIVEAGVPLRERMQKARIDDEDVLAAARKSAGLERMDQIKYAVLERDGGISIVPKKDA